MIDTYVAIYDEDCAGTLRADNVFIVQVAEIDVGRGPSPISGISQLEPHTAHKLGYLSFGYWYSCNERLFDDYLELTVAISAESEHREFGLRKVCVVERDTVERKNRLDEIIKANRFDKGRTVVIYFSLPTFGYLGSEGLWECVVNSFYP